MRIYALFVITFILASAQDVRAGDSCGQACAEVSHIRTQIEVRNWTTSDITISLDYVNRWNSLSPGPVGSATGRDHAKAGGCDVADTLAATAVKAGKRIQVSLNCRVTELSAYAKAAKTWLGGTRVRVTSSHRKALHYVHHARIDIREFVQAKTKTKTYTVTSDVRCFARRHGLYASPTALDRKFHDCNDAACAPGARTILNNQPEKGFPLELAESPDADDAEGGGSLVPFKGFYVVNQTGVDVQVKWTLRCQFAGVSSTTPAGASGSEHALAFLTVGEEFAFEATDTETVANGQDGSTINAAALARVRPTDICVKVVIPANGPQAEEIHYFRWNCPFDESTLSFVNSLRFEVVRGSGVNYDASDGLNRTAERENLELTTSDAAFKENDFVLVTGGPQVDGSTAAADCTGS